MVPPRCAATNTSEPSTSISSQLSSRRNPLVRQLRQLHDPRGRREQGLLLLEGTHLLQEVIRLGLNPRHLLATEAWLHTHAPLLAVLAPDCQRHQVTLEVLQAVATTQHPDGVVITLVPPPVSPLPPEERDGGFWLILDTIQDPGNLGTLMRTALAAGVQALWLADGADPFQPKVLRASAGAALALPLWRGGRAELVERLRTLRQRQGVQLVASLPPAQATQPYWQLDWTAPTALLLGSEGAGLAADLACLASHRVTVPHNPAVESLNVAVAAAPLLLERQRQQFTAGAGNG